MARPKDFPRDELAALLKDTSVTPAAIVAEMQLAGAERIDEPALADARALLSTLTSPDAAIDPAAVQRLPGTLRSLALDAAIAARHLPLIEALAQSSDKQVVKDAKRAIHALRSRGVQVEAPKAAAAPAEPAPVAKEDQPRAWLSLSDPAGERLVFVVQPTRGGVDVAEVVVSDDLGIADAHAAALTRKEWKRFMERLEARDGVLLAEVPRNYARWLICAAVDLADRRSLAIPSSFRSASFVLGPSVPPQPSPGRTLPVPADAAERAARTETPSQHPVLAKTRLPAPVVNRVRTAADREAAIRAHWTHEVRSAFADRLFDAAWLLQARGAVELVPDLVAIAAMFEADLPVESLALAVALFERTAPADPLQPLRSLLAGP